MNEPGKNLTDDGWDDWGSHVTPTSHKVIREMKDLSRLVEMLGRAVSTECAAISVIHPDQLEFVWTWGLDTGRVTRDVFFCDSVWETKRELIVRDVEADPIYCHHKFYLGEDRVRSYLGKPLRQANGGFYGVLSVFSTAPHSFTTEQIASFNDVATLIQNSIDNLLRPEDTPVVAPAQLTESSIAGAITRQMVDDPQLLQEMIDLSPHPIFVTDTSERYVMLNQATANMFGLPVDRVVGRTDRELLSVNEHEDFRRVHTQTSLNASAAGNLSIEEMEDSSGRLRRFRVSRLELTPSRGYSHLTLTFAEDITWQAEAERRDEVRARSFDQYRTAGNSRQSLVQVCRTLEGMVPHSAAFLWISETTDLALEVYPETSEFLAAQWRGSRESLDVVAKHANPLRRSNLLYSGEVAADERFIKYKEFSALYRFGGVWSLPIFSKSGAVLGVIDLLVAHARPPTNAELNDFRNAANHAGETIEFDRLASRKSGPTKDPVTQLPLRHAMAHRILSVRAQCKRDNSQFAVLNVALDNLSRFESLNTEYSNAVLSQVAERFSNAFRESDILFRGEGAEFFLVATGIQDAAAAERVADKLLKQLGHDFEVADQRFVVTAHIGVAMYPVDGEDAERLASSARAALHDCHTDTRRRRVWFFDSKIRQEMHERNEITWLVRGAARERSFEAYLQGQYNGITGNLLGYELLARLKNPQTGKLVPPDKFIPIAESGGEIHEIGRQMLEEAARCLSYFSTIGCGHLSVSVNVSLIEFLSPNFVDGVSRVINRNFFDARQLELEITESVVSKDLQETARRVRELRGLGVRIAMDDFGTGSSSFQLMREVQFDTVKLDKSFISPLSSPDAYTRQKAEAFLRGIIAFTNNVVTGGVVAEGVEDPRQRKFLCDLNVDRIQGYLYHLPTPIEEVMLKHEKEWHAAESRPSRREPRAQTPTQEMRITPLHRSRAVG